MDAPFLLPLALYTAAGPSPVLADDVRVRCEARLEIADGAVSAVASDCGEDVEATLRGWHVAPIPGMPPANGTLVVGVQGRGAHVTVEPVVTGPTPYPGDEHPAWPPNERDGTPPACLVAVEVSERGRVASAEAVGCDEPFATRAREWAERCPWTRLRLDGQALRYRSVAVVSFGHDADNTVQQVAAAKTGPPETVTHASNDHHQDWTSSDRR